MQFVSDYLFSIIIGGVILLIVLSLKFRGEQTSMDAIQYRAAKVGTLSLIAVIERDFNNIGSQRTDLTLKPEDAFVEYSPNAVPARIRFMAQADSLLPAQEIRYEWQPMPGNKTVQLKSGAVPLYEVIRYVDGVQSGMSTNMITSFEIYVQKKDSTSVTLLKGPGANGQQILVKLRAISPLGAGDAIEETRWEKMFRPVNLWKRREI